MATVNLSNLSNLISIEEYLNTTYRADLQSEIITILRNKQQDWSVRVAGENRVRVSPTRVRIPGVCVLSADRPRKRIIAHPPLLCIEVLSPWIS